MKIEQSYEQELKMKLTFILDENDGFMINKDR